MFLARIKLRLWFGLSAVAAVLAVALVSGCGDAVPGDAVAKVGSAVITKAQFDHWLGAAAKQQAQRTGGSPMSATVPDAPGFDKCAAQKASQPVPKGVPKPTAADLKAQCKQQYAGLRDQTMQFLISSQWLLQESAARGLKASDAEVMNTFQQQKKQAFPQEAAYQTFLKTSGQSQQDLLFRVRLSVLTNKLQQKIIQGAGTVTQKDIASYYAQNKQRFAQPETRDLLVVLNPKKPQADAALKAVKSGQSWAAVAKKYSTDAASKAQGGKLPGVARGQQERSFDSAIFAAPVNAVAGPVKTQFGYYVFRVTKVTPARQQTLAEATPTIQSLLRSQRSQTALSTFVKDFQKREKAKTKCAKDFLIPQQCSNAPTPKSTGPVSGGAPQGSAPPPSGAPQGSAPPSSGAPQGSAPPSSGAPQGSAPPSSGAPQGSAPPPPSGAPQGQAPPSNGGTPGGR
ncbi:MAG: hypothetical protein NVSMB25_21800 [Thermoleophilaceae bacterium]